VVFRGDLVGRLHCLCDVVRCSQAAFEKTYATTQKRKKIMFFMDFQRKRKTKEENAGTVSEASGQCHSGL